MALIQGMTSFALAMSSSKALRAMRKTVAVPEVHILLRATGGAAFWTKSPAWAARLTPRLFMIRRIARRFSRCRVWWSSCRVCVFQLTSKAQQDAAAELLGLEPSEQTRARILALARDETDIRKVARARTGS